jgi:hypothetical protein
VAPQGRDHWDKMGMGSALKALRSEAGEAMVLQNSSLTRRWRNIDGRSPRTARGDGRR